MGSIEKMFDHRHYVPILKSKRAEFRALHLLSSELKIKLTPVIDVIPVPWNFENDEPKKSLKAHLDNIIGYIVKSWPDRYHMFFDLMYVSYGNEVIEGRHSLVYCLESLRRHNRKIIPVTGLGRDESYQNAIKTTLKGEKTGLCFRIQQDDLDNVDNLADSIDNLLKEFDTAPRKCDVILDFQALPFPEVHDPVAYISNIIRVFPNLTKWRTFTIASSNFPRILEMTADSTDLIRREEYHLWHDVVMSNDVPRLPSFGDYSIQHPDMSDVDYRKLKISVNLRYATETHWLVYKGREKNRYGYNQFNRICRDLINRPEYSGPRFSAGDYYIDCCARNTDGPGNTETWRRVGFNHHMTLVVRQLANFDGP